MITNLNNVREILIQSQPTAIRLAHGRLPRGEGKTTPVEIHTAQKSTAQDAIEEIMRYCGNLGNGIYHLRYCEVSDASSKPIWQHSKGIEFEVGANQSFQQYPQAGMPAVGNPYPTGRTYSKEEVEETVAREVRLVKMEMEMDFQKKDFLRQIKEAKEDGNGGAVGRVIDMFGPILAQQMAGGMKPAAVAGPQVYATPQQPQHEPQHEADSNGDAPFWVTPELAMRYDAATNGIYEACNPDGTLTIAEQQELYVSRLEKLQRLASNPAMLSMLDNF